MSGQSARHVDIIVSYNQLCVFHADIDAPFNDWNAIHVQQGFSWRPGSVSFATLENTTTHVGVILGPNDAPVGHARRIIVVPFEVPGSGRLIVGSIGDEHEITVPQGLYELWFELEAQEENPQCRLRFTESPAS